MNYITLLFFGLLPFILPAQNPYIVKSDTQKSTPSSDNRSEFSKQFKYLAMADWKQGMRFLCVNNYLFGDTHFSLIKYDRNVIVAPKLYIKGFEGKIFTVDRIEERKFEFSGKLEATWACVVFKLDSSYFEFVYKKGGIDKLREDDESIMIEDLIGLDEIDLARDKLVGKTVYLLTNQWLRDEADGEVNIDGKKFTSAKVTKVGVGNHKNPVKIVFQLPNGSEAHLMVSISHINGLLRHKNQVTTDFDAVFSLHDPKKKYPNISAATWTLIQSGKVKIGMTKQECILSWGEPLEKNATISSGSKHEQWVYGSNSYLYFTNGKLTSIQN